MTATPGILILGIGNVLHGDDGVGVRVVEALGGEDAARAARPGVTLRDGGTIGLALLPEIEDASALIVVDAAELGARAGTVRVFEGRAMDAQLGGRKRTVHEVTLSDLLASAQLTGRRPARRALVAIQPESTDWRTTPSEAVAAAIPRACEAVASLIDRWNDVAP
ncbi:MAG TPA: HyaD/HybD family hydrogenase maturation endopeptidase [Usitatibacter sp.]|nr:HyaD/HybD family hydrogenase maturation endopeptidase [Usitatibacter sp.]